VLVAEPGAIHNNNMQIPATAARDPVTNDLVIAILRDEERHRRLFEGFLREYDEDRASS
jgi:bacterioferritin